MAAIKITKTMEPATGGKVVLETGPNGGKVLTVTAAGAGACAAHVTLTAEEVAALKAEL
jgi:hypothetical protein